MEWAWISHQYAKWYAIRCLFPLPNIFKKIGRAGRDKEHCTAVQIYKDTDFGQRIGYIKKCKKCCSFSFNDSLIYKYFFQSKKTSAYINDEATKKKFLKELEEVRIFFNSKECRRKLIVNYVSDDINTAAQCFTTKGEVCDNCDTYARNFFDDWFASNVLFLDWKFSYLLNAYKYLIVCYVSIISRIRYIHLLIAQKRKIQLLIIDTIANIFVKNLFIDNYLICLVIIFWFFS